MTVFYGKDAFPPVLALTKIRWRLTFLGGEVEKLPGVENFQDEVKGRIRAWQLL